MCDEEPMDLEQISAKSDQPRGFPTVTQVVGIWKEKFDQGLLNDSHFKEHWRLYVPQVLNLDPSNSCFDNLFDKDHVQNILFAPLEEFICNGNPNEVFKYIKSLDESPTICGKLFKMSEPTYNCRECGTDSTCVLCVECFKKSEHRNHKYKMAISSGGGCCDCGDVEAWKSDPCCSVHIVGTLENSRTAELSEDMVRRTKLTFHAILQYAYHLLTIDHSPELPKGLRLREEEEDPLSYLDSLDTYCTVLYNDEVHTFENVIQTLTKVIKCSQKDAVELVTNIDREGRAVVKCSTFHNCTELKSEVERITSRSSSRPLRVQVTHSHVIAHQLYAIKLLSWFQKILSYSKYLRTILAEVVLEKSASETSILEGVLLRDSSLWKAARVHWHRLFMAGMLKEYENKKLFAKVFTKNYGSIMKDFVRDDHDHAYSVAVLSVQVYTVPTIAHYLIAHQDVLLILLNTFLSECNSNTKEGKLEFQRSEHGGNTPFKRAQSIICDLHYLLSSVPEKWTDELRQGFSQGLHLFLKLLSFMQGMDPVTRQVGQHMEYEPEWETAFNLHIKLSTVITSMLKWCGTDKNIMIKTYRLTLKKLFEHPCRDLNNFGEVRELADHSTTCIVYDVGSQLVSIHLPLSRFLAGLHVQLEKFGLNFYSSEFDFKFKQSPEQIIEPVLRTQVMISQVHAGLWRRNGYSILHQIFFYHNVKCRNEMLNKDIILLQVGASLIESNDFLIHMLNKFNLINWSDPRFEESYPKKTEEDCIRQTITLVEEFLALLVTIISERYVLGIGNVTEQDCVKKEIIQQLCIKPLSHSELCKVLPDIDYNDDASIDSIIHEVATFQKPAAGSGRGLYTLKPEYYDQYNVFFYHYTKEELSKSEEAQRQRHKLESSLDCCPPPVLPPLTEAFSLLVNLLQCDVMFHITQLILKRACDLKARSFSESQLHRILYLIGYALREEESQRCEFFVFTERSEKWAVLYYLEELLGNARVEAYRDLIKWTINKFKQVLLISNQNKEKQSESKNVAEMVEVMADDANDNKVKREKERIGKLAADRRAKILAEMSFAQKSFIKENAKLYEEATSMDTHSVEEQMLWESSAESIKFPIALGGHQTAFTSLDPSYVCILCQEAQTIRIDSPAMVFGAFVQKSSVLRVENASPVQHMNAEDVYFLASTLTPSPFTSICGHVMHSTCWEKYFNNISTKESRRPYRLRQPISFDVEKNEFLCPLCESLNNSILPVLPPLGNIKNMKPVFDEHLSFESWLKSVILATEKKQQELKKKNISDAKRAKSAMARLKKREKKDDDDENMPADGTAAFENSTESGATTSEAQESASVVQDGNISASEPSGSSFFWDMNDDLNNTLDLSGGRECESAAFLQDNEEMEILLFNSNAEEASDNLTRVKSPAISESLKNMIGKYAKSVYAKGIGSLREDEQRYLIFCWKSCAYTIHVVETVLRNETRSLLGHLSTRQKKCIQSLIRLSALQEICKNQRIVNNYALTLLAIVFDNSQLLYSTNLCILDWDPFGMLVSLIMSLPSLFFLQKPSPLPSGTVLDLYTTKLMLIATVAQIIIGVAETTTTTSPSETEQNNRTEDTECLRTYWSIRRNTTDVVTTTINTASLWKQVTDSALPFLRCVCIFYRYLTGVPAPACLKEVGGDTYKNMCRYLGLPITCDELLNNELVMKLFKKWVEKWRGSPHARHPSPSKCEKYLAFTGLISLPEDYSELINSISSFTCPNSDHEDSRNPTLCLVCGTMLCSQSYCCQKDLNGSLVGACAYHANTCGAGAGIFLRIRECEILLLSCPNRGCYLAPPFVDQYGETDQGLKRGNPLTLCRERYKKLENIWLGHSIHEEVSRSMETSHSINVTPWHHL